MSIYHEYICRDPICRHVTRIYSRKLNEGMVASLIVLYNTSRRLNRIGGWIHIPNDLSDRATRIVLQGREYFRLSMWGFLESKPSLKHDGNSSGEWRVTQTGIEFVTEPGFIVPRLVYERKSEVLFHSDGGTDIIKGGVSSIDLTDIHEALGDKFDYNELMQIE